MNSGNMITAYAAHAAHAAHRVVGFSTTAHILFAGRHEHLARKAIVSPDSKWVFSVSSDMIVQWNRITERAVRIYRCDSRFTDIDLSADGSLLVSTDDSNIRIWHIDTGSQVLVLPLPAPTHLKPHVMWRPMHSDQILVSGDQQGCVQLYSVKDGQLIRTYPDATAAADAANAEDADDAKVAAHEHKRVLAVSSDGNILAHVQDCSICIIDIHTNKVIHRLLGHVDNINTVCFSRDGTILVSVSATMVIKIWSVRDGQLLRTLKTNKRCTHVCMSPCGRMLLGASRLGGVTLFDVTSGAVMQTISWIDIARYRDIDIRGIQWSARHAYIIARLSSQHDDVIMWPFELVQAVCSTCFTDVTVCVCDCAMR